MYEICLANLLAQACVHFVAVRASLCTDNEMSGPPIRAKYMHVDTICEQTSDNSPNDSSSSSLMWRSSKQKLETLYNCSAFLFTNSQSLHALLGVSLHVVDHMLRVLRAVCPILVMFQLLWQKYVIRTSFCTVPQYLRLVFIHAQCIPSTHDQGVMLVHGDQRLSSISSTWKPYSASFLPI